MFAICLLHIFIGLLENLEVWNIQRKFEFDLQTQLFQSLPTRSGCFVSVLSCKANHDIARNRIREQNYLLCSLDWKRYVHLFGMHVTLPGKKKTSSNICKDRNLYHFICYHHKYATYLHTTQQYNAHAGRFSLEPCLMTAFPSTVPLWFGGKASGLGLTPRWRPQNSRSFPANACVTSDQRKKITLLSKDFILSFQIRGDRCNDKSIFIMTLSGTAVAKCLYNVHKPLLNFSVRIMIQGIVLKSIYTRYKRKRRSNKIWMPFFKMFQLSGCTVLAVTAAIINEFRFRQKGGP